MDIYTTVLRPLLFSGLKADPEYLHQQVMQLLNQVTAQADRPPVRWLRCQIQQSCCFSHPALEQTLWGQVFPNPLGLAAGFDKDGEGVLMWPDFGFGYAELGTVTYQAQPGNPKPRLFRLLADRAALNRMGFNNDGAAALAAQLARFGELTYPIGINLGKSKLTPLEDAAADYCQSFRLLRPYGAYFVVNVSSPNTPGLRSLQAVEQLEPILASLQAENLDRKPLLVKIAPDLEWDDIAAIVDLAQRHQLAGIVATNTTIRRDQLKIQVLPATGNPITEEAGGISGAPLRQRSTDVIRFVYQQTQGQLPIIGVGGIFTADDAWEKITAGASLLQIYTGWIYEGPWMVKRLLRDLVAKVTAAGYASISEAIGQTAHSR